VENLIIDYTKSRAVLPSLLSTRREGMSDSEKDSLRDLEIMMLQVNEVALKISKGEEIPEDVSSACKEYMERFPGAFKKMVEMNRKFMAFSLLPPNCS